MLIIIYSHLHLYLSIHEYKLITETDVWIEKKQKRQRNYLVRFSQIFWFGLMFVYKKYVHFVANKKGEYIFP